MLWLLFAILAYFFFAISVFIDRFLVKGPLKSPFAYAFYSGILTSTPLLFFLLNFFFGFLKPFSLFTFLIGTLAGFFTVWTLLAWFILVSKEEVSRASPIVGAIQPIFIVLISLLFFLEQAIPSRNEFSAFLLFLLGSFIIMQEPEKLFPSRAPRLLFFLSSFYFAFSLVMLKTIFLLTNFWTAIFLLGIGSFIGTLSLLLLPETRTDLAKKGLPLQKEVFFPLVIGRIVGTFGAVFQLAAIFLAKITQVPLISAMTGLQFLFLYILLFIFLSRFPEMEEKMVGKALFKKLAGLVIIGLGFLVLALK